MERISQISQAAESGQGPLKQEWPELVRFELAAAIKKGPAEDPQDRSRDSDKLPANPIEQEHRTDGQDRLEDGTGQLLLKTFKQLRQAVGLSSTQLSKIEDEIKAGKFGPQSAKAYDMCAHMLQGMVMGNLKVLSGRGLEIPAGCPLEPPVDPLSGRHIVPEWFRAQIESGDLRLKLTIDAGQVPSAGDIARLGAAAFFSGRAVKLINSTIIESNFARLQSELASHKAEGNFKGWLPQTKELSDKEKEKWTYAAQSWLNAWAQVRNYARSIAQINAATRQSSEPDKLFGLPMYKWTTIARQIFPDEALKDENFPGHIERDEKGNITSMSIDAPSTLERSSANLDKIEKLQKWLEKYAPAVDQLMDEVRLAAAKEGRLLAWAEIPVEGTIKSDGTVDFSENPGILAGGRALAPGEKEFNLREFRFTAREVMKDGQKMIAVSSTQSYEYAPAWAIYNCYSYTQKKVVSGTEQEPVYYRPDDYVVIMDNGRSILMQAKNLDTFSTESKTWHYGGKTVNVAMDLGFCALGGIEAGAIWRLAAKEATEQGFKAALCQGIKKAALSRASWHAFLGTSGVLARPIEEMFGPYGHDLMKYRAYAMLGDITLNQTFVGNWAKTAWGASRGTAAVEKASALEELMATQRGIMKRIASQYKTAGKALLSADDKLVLRLASAYKLTGKMLLATEFLQIGDICGSGIPATLAQKRKDETGKKLGEARESRGPAFVPDVSSMIAIESLMKESDRVKSLAEGSSQRKSEEKDLTAKLIDTFLDSSFPDEKLAAALSLLNLKGKENADAPESLGSRIKDGTTDEVKLADIQSFLREYQQMQMRSLLMQYSTLMPVDQMLARTAEMLGLPAENRQRQEHIDNLAGTFLRYKEMKANINRLSVALEQARKEEHDGERQSAQEKDRLAKNVADLTMQLTKAKADWQAADKRQGAAAALGLIAFLDGGAGHDSGKVKFDDVTAYLEQQLQTSAGSDIKYVLSDMLFRMGRLDVWQYLSTCQDILRDRSVDNPELARQLKLAVLFNESSPRTGELLEIMRYQFEPQLDELTDAADRARAMSHTYGRDAAACQETLLSVVRNQKEDADVRALCARQLLACGTATSKGRQEQFRQWRQDWRRCRKEPGLYARQFIQSLKKDLAAEIRPSNEAAGGKAMDRKFQAALVLSELGGPAELGLDRQTRAETTQAMIDCFLYTEPALALQVLPHLVPERLSELSSRQLKDVRDTFQQMLGAGFEAGRTSPEAVANGMARTPLRLAVMESFPLVFDGAGSRQKKEIVNTLKAIVAYDERYKRFFASGSSELRMAAIDTLVKLASNDGAAGKAETAEFLGNILGAGERQKKDASADVRRAALIGLEKLGAEDLQATALKLLKVEKDPLVINALWSLEYSRRRADGNAGQTRSEEPGRRLKAKVDVNLLTLNELEALKPGSPGSPLTVDDASIVACGILERDLRRLPRHDVPRDPLDNRTLEAHMPAYRRSQHMALEQSVLRFLQKYPSDRVIPLLESLAEDNIVRDAAGRPVKVAYPNGKSRDFVYEDDASFFPVQITEQPKGEVWTRGDASGIFFDWTSNKGGKRTMRDAVVLPNGQFSYEDADRVRHTFAESGAEVRKKGGQVIQVTYPDGSARCFTYRKYNDGYRTSTEIAGITELPAGISWKRSKDDARVWKNNNGKTMRSYCDFVAGSFNCYTSRGGEDGTYCRVTTAGDTHVMQVFTTDGAELQVRNGVVTEIAPGAFKHSVHPCAEVRQAAKALLSRLKEGTSLRKTESDFERAFDQAKAKITKGEQRAFSMSWVQWQQWYRDHGLHLLDPVNLAQIQHSAVARRWEGHWWERHTSSQKFIDSEEQKAKDAQTTHLWDQFEQLVDMARTKGDTDQEGIEARQALVYIIVSGGETFNSQFRRQAVKRAAEGILDICKGHAAGRGDLDRAIEACLVEHPEIDPIVRFTLLKALDELVAPKGDVSKETGASIAARALEAEYHNQPVCTEPGYPASVQLQLALLKRVSRWGNSEMVPVLEAVSKFHSDDTVKQRAAELKVKMQKQATE